LNAVGTLRFRGVAKLDFIGGYLYWVILIPGKLNALEIREVLAYELDPAVDGSFDSVDLNAV